MEEKLEHSSPEISTEHNLLTNFDQTVALIKQIEGESWYRSYFNDVKSLAERLKRLTESDLDSEEVIDSFYGDGGVTRWMVMANGEVRFSAFHDTGDIKKAKTKKAEALGFKLF